MRVISRLVFCLGMAFSQISYGQTDGRIPYVIPPSPNAAALARQVNIGVSYYTGVPSVSFPFPELRGKDITVPISIDYQASGIKIQDVASSVGIGFNLNAGGMITRVVRGLPDGSKPRCGTTVGDLWSTANGECDGERDIYFVSILGRTGKFFIDESENTQFMPYQDLKGVYSPTTPDAGGSFTITDELGYKYLFGQNDSTREQTTYYLEITPPLLHTTPSRRRLLYQHGTCARFFLLREKKLQLLPIWQGAMPAMSYMEIRDTIAEREQGIRMRI